MFMNWKKANLDICNTLIGGEMVRGQTISDEQLLIIPREAFYGYIFSPKDIAFSMQKVKMLPPDSRQIFKPEAIVPENELKVTQSLRLASWKKIMARKFISIGKSVWVDTKFLKCIDVAQCKFYQEENPLECIFVTENDKPVMCILPMRIIEEHEE